MILEQFSNLKLAKFEIVLQSQREAVLPALIGSTLRGAFGHALKAISCSVQHQDCNRCFLSEACLYPTIFEPTSASKIKNIPRPFIFEPPIPPITRDISLNETLKLRVAENGKISFGLTLIGEAIAKLPYFIYAFELMARHGLGAERQTFSVAEVLQIGAGQNKRAIYTPNSTKVLPLEETDLAELVEYRLEKCEPGNILRIHLQTPLRIRRNKRLLEKITFNEFFKQCSLRLKFLAENYGSALEYDYQNLMKSAEKVQTVSEKIWRHGLFRRSNSQDKSLNMDGMLGEVNFRSDDLSKFLPFLAAGEFLNIGSASSLGLGKYALQ